MANRTITLFGIDFDVEYTATPFQPATFHDPASGGEIEIESICVGGFEFEDGVLSDQADQAIRNHIANHVDSWAAEERDSAAESRAEARYLEAA